MKKNNNLNDILIQLAKLSLTGRQQDIQTYIRRLSRKIVDEFPDISTGLNALLKEGNSVSSPLRNLSVPAIPVDRDSRLNLVRIEDPVQIDINPIWDSSIEDALNQIVQEKQFEKDLLLAGLTLSKSLLFCGNPGVGKTLAARWLSNILGLPLIILDLSAVMSSYLGRTGVNIRNVFDYAKGTNCVLLLDELDAVAKKRDDNAELGELKRLVTVLLQEIDDWPQQNLLIAATNHSQLLDPAIWRRFDIVVEFPMPNEEQLLKAVHLYLGKDTSKASSLIFALVKLLDGSSFSEIEREVTRIRRLSIVKQKPIKQIILSWAKDRISSLDKDIKIDLSASLVNSGITQRKASELTGISRDTIRKYMKT